MASTTVHATAEAALYEAASWYQDEEPSTTLWLELFDELEAVLGLLRQHPESGRVYKGRVRRALLSRFPYAIYYVVEGDEIIVINFLAMRLERGSTVR